MKTDKRKSKRVVSAEAKPDSPATHGSELRIQGTQARLIIKNVHALVRHKFRGASLWSLVGQITGHGSGYSYDICKSANLNPNQCCGGKELLDDVPNMEVCDGGRKTSELKQDANRHSQH